MSIKLKLTLVTLFLGCSLVQPVHAQWVKVGKTVSKQAVKALKSGKTTTVIRKSTQRTTTGSTLGMQGMVMLEGLQPWLHSM